MLPHSLQDLIARQSGVISRGQALEAGLTPAAVDDRLRLRRWRPVHPGVYLAGGHPYDDEARARAAGLWAGPGAVLSGLAAAWWHGMVEEAPVRVTVTVPEPRRHRSGVVARHHRIAAEDIVERRGLPVTAPALAALEAAVELGAAGEVLLDHLLQHRVAFPEVRAAHLRNLAAPGATSAARMLLASADRSAAAAEDVLVRMLREAGTRGWHRGVPAAGRPAPVVFPAARVAIEVTGWAWRPGEPNLAARPGWRVLRFSWADLTSRPRAVPAEAMAIVRASRP
jgi:hypothetical protein